MKKIVFVCQSTNYLLVDVLNEFSLEYDSVFLLSSNFEVLERRLNNKVNVVNIISYNKKSLLTRIWTWVYGTLQIFFILFFKFNKYEIVYATNPPMSYFCSLLLRNPFSIIVFDIYPDALKNIGLTERNLVYRFWAYLNKIIFKRASAIITLSKGMYDKLTQYTNKEKVFIINNWSGFDKFMPIEKNENNFLNDNSLSEKFIILYSGNMGFTHSLETLIYVAETLVNFHDIVFVFIGEGEKKKGLQSMVNELKLTNCKFFSWQDSYELSFSLAAADIGVVSINNDTAELSVPSKTYNLLSVGAPLLCIAPKNSELKLLVKKYNNGLCFEAENIDLIKDYILNLKMNKSLQHEFSVNSIKASKDFHFSNSKKYLDVIGNIN